MAKKFATNVLQLTSQTVSGDPNFLYLNSIPIKFNGVTGISVTGSNSITGKVNFTGIGGTLVILNGNDISFSGGAGGGGTTNIYNNGVTGIQVSGLPAITGLVTITGANIISVQNSGNIITISGDTSNLATIGNLYSTGSTLDNKVNVLSGWVSTNPANIVYTTGDQSINGVKTFNGSVSGVSITGYGVNTETLTASKYIINQFNSGCNTPIHIFNFNSYSTQLVTLTGLPNNIFTFSGAGMGAGKEMKAIVTSTGIVTGIYYPSQWTWINQKPSGMSAGSQMVLTFTCTGANNDGVIASYGRAVGGLGIGVVTNPASVAELLSTSGALSDRLTQTGQILYSFSSAISGNLASTGSTLDNKINSLSGYAAPASRPTVTGINITGGASYTGLVSFTGFNIVLTYITGQNGMTGNYINLSGDTSILATVSNLTQTGVSLGTRIDGVSNNLISGISVTGSSSLTGLISITGAGTVVTQRNGNTIFISGTNPGIGLAIGTIPQWNGTAFDSSYLVHDTNGTTINGITRLNAQGGQWNNSNLITNDSYLPISVSRIALSSDNSNPNSRTFNLLDGFGGIGSEDGMWTILRWEGTGAGILSNTGTNLTLYSDWRPISGDMLSLIWDSTNVKWREQWRYPNSGLNGSSPSPSVTGISITGSNSITGKVNISGIGSIKTILSGNTILISGAASSSVNGVTGISVTGSNSIINLVNLTGLGIYTNLNGNTITLENNEYVFNSISELRSFVPTNNSQKAFVLGYYEKNDGGEGPLFWDVNSTVADNSGTYFKPNSLSNGRWIRTDTDEIVNVKKFGAAGTGLDDHSYINVAATYQGTGRTLFFPPNSNFICNNSIFISGNVLGDSSTIFTNYTGGPLITLGRGNGVISNNSFILPRIVHLNASSNRSITMPDIGLKVLNVTDSHFRIPQIQGFTRGLYLIGSGFGCAYNNFQLGNIVNNTINLETVASDGGFCNECSYFGGRLSHASSRGISATGTRHIVINQDNNHHRFFSTTVEGDEAEYHILSIGHDNYFNSFRWEITSGISKVLYSGGSANNNLIFYGDYANRVLVMESGGAGQNHFYSSELIKLSTTNKTGALLLHSSNTSNPTLVGYDGGSGIFNRHSGDYSYSLGGDSAKFKFRNDKSPRVEINYTNGANYLGFGDGTVTPPLQFTSVDNGRLQLKSPLLDITGKIMIRGGTPGADKFLISDSTGLANWQNPSDLTISGYFRNAAGGYAGHNLIPISADAWRNNPSLFKKIAGNTPSISIQPVTGKTAGGTSHQFHLSSPVAGGSWYYIDQLISINPDSTYRGKLWAARPDGTGKLYAGYIAYDSGLNTLAGNGGTYGYFIANSHQPPPGGTYFSGYIAGEGAANNSFPTGTRYIRPLVVSNYDTSPITGIMQVADFEISQVPYFSDLESTGVLLKQHIDNLSGWISTASSNIVYTSGAQTISGVKTFFNNTIVSGIGFGVNPTQAIDFSAAQKNIKFVYTNIGEEGGSLASLLGNNLRVSTTGSSRIEVSSSATDASHGFYTVYNRGWSFISLTGGKVAGTVIPVDANTKVRITTSGEVGILTTSPMSQLDVRGGITGFSVTGYRVAVPLGGEGFFSGTTNIADMFMSSTIANIVYTTGAQTIDGAKTFTSNLIITGANLGVGLSSPASRVHISGGLTLAQQSQGANQITFRNQNNTDKWYFYTSNPDKFFIYSTDFGANLITFTTGGNVGINTISPTSQLHVNGGITGIDITGHTVKSAANTFDRYICNQLNSGYSGATNLTHIFNFNSNSTQLVTLTGVPNGIFTFSGAGMGAGKELKAIITTTGIITGMVYPTAWSWINQKPSGLNAGAKFVITLTCTGSNDDGVIASYGRAVGGGGIGTSVQGNGTTNYIPRWSAANTLTNSTIIDNGLTLNFVGNYVSGTQPESSTLAIPVSTTVFGSTTGLLGVPKGWIDINISGISAKIPYY